MRKARTIDFVTSMETADRYVGTPLTGRANQKVRKDLDRAKSTGALPSDSIRWMRERIRLQIRFSIPTKTVSCVRCLLASCQASDLNSANVVLRVFAADYNRRLAGTSRETTKVWRPIPENLDCVYSFLHERIVGNDNVVQWEGRHFQIPPQNRRFSFAGTKVQLYQALDGRVSLFYDDALLEHTCVHLE
jgi:hypothetical protein